MKRKRSEGKDMQSKAGRRLRRPLIAEFTPKQDLLSNFVDSSSIPLGSFNGDYALGKAGRCEPKTVLALRHEARRRLAEGAVHAAAEAREEGGEEERLRSNAVLH